MISKNRQRLIRSLERKKGREEAGLFVAEGPKLVGELLTTMRPAYVVATDDWAGKADEHVSPDELSRISLVRTPQQVLALFPLPSSGSAPALGDIARRELCLALDGVQDPGNVGTIVRLCDWFGLRHVYCSPQTADIYSPKATQATMGALSRVEVHYVDLAAALTEADCPVYATHLHGTNIYESTLTQTGVIVMGNEGKGVSPEVASLATHKLFIPPFPREASTVESLNVAIATAVVCAEFRRRV